MKNCIHLIALLLCCWRGSIILVFIDSFLGNFSGLKIVFWGTLVWFSVMTLIRRDLISEEADSRCRNATMDRHHIESSRLDRSRVFKG
ncbi:hypothetical protein L2E82_02592 [Cichorium intybus]|uniref:Uncharacterized protein n=1 Tax=Cichorium intybus TaxID=13427 RepID=A0ACB9H1S9_CICIN|nr:hypothetical protein L2E82_02592 [Cichorium intybus]